MMFLRGLLKGILQGMDFVFIADPVFIVRDGTEHRTLVDTYCGDEGCI